MPTTPSPTRRYSTDLTDEQWALIRPLVQRERHKGAPTRIDLREVVNALLYLNRTGCPWRLLPSNFPNWNTVRYYFDQWTLDGTFVRINDALRGPCSTDQGATPGAECRDHRQPDGQDDRSRRRARLRWGKKR